MGEKKKTLNNWEEVEDLLREELTPEQLYQRFVLGDVSKKAFTDIMFGERRRMRSPFQSEQADAEWVALVRRLREKIDMPEPWVHGPPESKWLYSKDVGCFILQPSRDQPPQAYCLGHMMVHTEPGVDSRSILYRGSTLDNWHGWAFSYDLAKAIDWIYERSQYVFMGPLLWSEKPNPPEDFLAKLTTGTYTIRTGRWKDAEGYLWENWREARVIVRRRERDFKRDGVLHPKGEIIELYTDMSAGFTEGDYQKPTTEAEAAKQGLYRSYPYGYFAAEGHALEIRPLGH